MSFCQRVESAALLTCMFLAAYKKPIEGYVDTAYITVRVQTIGFRVQGLGKRVQGFRSRVQTMKYKKRCEKSMSFCQRVEGAVS